MHDSYEAWEADYGLAMEQGRDHVGRDVFDLLYEKMRDAGIGLWFDGSFRREDQANDALKAFESMGYDREYSWIKDAGPQRTAGRWMLHASRPFIVTSADAFRNEVAAGKALLEGLDAIEVDWEFEPDEGNPGTGPPL